MTTPGIQHLTGYRLRDYDDAIATLKAAADRQRASLRSLAARIGCATSTLSENLTGIHRMDAANLLALADALGYDLALIPREDA